MACVSGTNIVNDGLVFHFDLENGAKSWKGKPTSNLIAGSILTNWSGTGSRVADTAVLNETYNGGTIYHLEDATGVDPDTEVDNYYMYNSYSPVVAGEQYTFSMDVKVLQKSNSTKVGASNCFWIWYAQSTEYVYFSDLPLNEWSRVHVTCTVGSTYNYIIPRIDYDNSIVEIANLQLETGNIATKFVNGARLDTASIVDVSPTQSTITAANLTYRQDDTPTFDGTNDYCLTDITTINENATYEVWVKRASSVNGYNMVMGQYLPYFAMRSDNRVHFSMNVGGQKNLFTDYNVITDNTWYLLTFTHDYDGVDTVASIFINGEFQVSGTYAGAQATSSGRQFMIGGWRSDSPASYPFYGEVSQVKLYNRALTTQEVKQNFEATRSRYGI